MARQAFLPAKGLYLDWPSHQVPDGALSVATNVSIRRPGVIEPRLGIRETGGSPSDAVLGWAPFMERMYADLDNDVVEWTDDGGSTWTDLTGAGTPPSADYRRMFASLRDTLFLTANTGVLRHDTTTGDAVDRAGLPRPALGLNILLSSVAGELWLPNTNLVAYRVVYRRDYANGVTVRSAPSGRYVVTNDAGAARAVALTIFVSPGLRAGDVVEVYRSAVTATQEPSDQMLMAVEHVLTTSEASSTSFALQDGTSEGSRGTALYINTDIEGVEAENQQPPKANVLAAWGDRLWASGTTKPHSMVLELHRDNQGWGRTAPLAGTTNVGTSQITGISAADIAKLEVGMLVQEVGTAPSAASARLAANTRITIVGGTTVTVNPAPLANAAISFYGSDVVTVDGVEFIAYLDEVSGSLNRFNSPNTGNAQRSAVQSLAYVINNIVQDVRASVTGSATRTFLTLERLDHTTGSFTFTTTRRDAWSIVPRTGTSVAEARPERIYYSKAAQPEHWPPTNYLDVGDPQYRTLRLLPVGTVLYVLRQDGVWRVRTDGDGFAVDAVGTLHPLQSESADSFHDGTRDVGYVWCREGVYALTEQGLYAEASSVWSSISAPIHEALRDITGYAARADAPQVGLWLAAHPREREVWLSDGFDTGAYVFNLDTSTWTFVDLPLQSARYNPTDSTMWFGKVGETGAWRQRRSGVTTTAGGDDWEHFDEEEAVTADDVAGNLVTLSASHAFEIGDALSADGENQPLALIVSVDALNDTVTVDDGSVLAAGTLRWMKAFESTVSWVPVNLRLPHRAKHWSEAALHWESLVGVRTFGIFFLSDKDAISSGGTIRTFTRPTAAVPRNHSWIVPAAQAHGHRLGLTLELRQAASKWAISGLEAFFDVLSGRARAG